MSGWSNTSMSELCDITSSKRIHRSDYVEAGVPFYRGKEITEKYNGKLDVSTELFISEEQFAKIKMKFGAPLEGDLLLTSVGTLGSPYVVKRGDRFYFKDGNLTWFRNLRGIDSHFLYYWIASPSGRAELKKATIGSSQSAYTIVLLKQMQVSLPPLPIQKKIASILSAYDALIENNERRIKILEEMAQNLYREWFVNFRFPGHEKVKMVDSPLGQIPDGWEYAKVGSFGKVLTGKTPSKKNPAFYGDYMPFIKTPSMHGQMFCIEVEEHLSEAGAASQPAKTLPPNSLCVSCIGTAGVVSISSCKSQTNQQINSLVPRHEYDREFLYFALTGLRDTIQRHGAAGATMTNLSKGKFESLPVLTPQSTLRLRFHEKASPLFDLIHSLSIKNVALRQTRDLLLPKLISGQLDVSELDIEVGE